MADEWNYSDDKSSALEKCLARLADGDVSARDDVIAFAIARMRRIAHRMLRRFPMYVVGRRPMTSCKTHRSGSIEPYRNSSPVTCGPSSGSSLCMFRENSSIWHENTRARSHTLQTRKQLFHTASRTSLGVRQATAERRCSRRSSAGMKTPSLAAYACWPSFVLDGAAFSFGRSMERTHGFR